MKTTAELKASAAELELAQSLVALGGCSDMAREARAELMVIYGEIERRQLVNAEQARLYKKGK